MRLAFAGTPEFALPALEALHGAGHDIATVLTQPDRPAGRGRQLQASAVARRAAELGLAVHKPPRLDAAAQALLRELAPQALVVVAYGLILPQAVLDIPPLGCINIHASLLPRWRGAAPIARAVEAGDSHSGITIMRMDAGLDTGPMLLAETVPIARGASAADLERVLAPLGARLIVQALAGLAAGTLAAVPQPAQGATYAKKLGKDEAHLDFSRPAVQLARQVRAYNPAPVAWAQLGEERLRLWDAQAVAGSGEAPGTVIAAGPDGLELATGEGRLLVTRLQRPGGRPLAAAEALRGWNPAGRRFS